MMNKAIRNIERYFPKVKKFGIFYALKGRETQYLIKFKVKDSVTYVYVIQNYSKHYSKEYGWHKVHHLELRGKWASTTKYRSHFILGSLGNSIEEFRKELKKYVFDRAVETEKEIVKEKKRRKKLNRKEK